ncbi:MAG: bifunctional phosphopantothenoylcysteine decarboxylase/phosphopantothenate--cysteine ligase CoaBC [Chloroflexi bacterium]|nr:bifunctional phosphopantothenoylcysteine decarboxylase/phosphopantothenate--cysteine ligase CoaBC [Chloroflexota bacterium]
MLANKTIVLGITGGIAAYKVADLASKLTQAGARVEIIMTKSATEFITPLTFRSLTHRTVVTEMFNVNSEFSIGHVALATAADVIVIAPATANIVAKIAGGIADDMLSATVLATEAPVIVAPAMNVNMYQNPATQDNLAKLKARGFIFVGPGYGRLASGKIGMGRLTDIEEIIGTIKQVLGRSGDLAGKNIVVTAGGTQEAIDPVRYIGNRSSGKMGYAVAEAARDRGAKVTLITAPTALSKPVGVAVTPVTTAVQMKKAVVKAVAQTDVLIMVAAVADYQPKSVAKGKIKKETTGAGLTLELVKTPDILAEVKGDFIKVGFAAETEDIVANARKKLANKQLDIIAVNDVTSPDSGFGVDTNRVTLISHDGKVESLPLMSKREVADRILDKVVGMLTKKPQSQMRRGVS